MSAQGIDKVSHHSQVRSGEKQAKRTEKAAARAQARAAKRKGAGSEPASDTPTPSTPSGSSASASSSTSQTEAPASTSSTSSSSRKNFIGDLKGAKIVNFAVQGGQANNAISVFASGEGPNAKKVSSTSEKTSTDATTKVDTVA